MAKKEVRVQHYVPRVYMNQWSVSNESTKNKNKRVNVFNKNNCEYSSVKSYDICCDDYTYDSKIFMDEQAIENMLGKFETNLKSRIDLIHNIAINSRHNDIIKNRLIPDGVKNKDPYIPRDIILYITSVQLLRTDQGKDWIGKVVNIDKNPHLLDPLKGESTYEEFDDKLKSLGTNREKLVRDLMFTSSKDEHNITIMIQLLDKNYRK